MPSRFGLLAEGMLVAGVLVLWGMFYVLLNPPTKPDLGDKLYGSLGTHELLPLK